LAYESVLVISAMHEVDGRVRLMFTWTKIPDSTRFRSISAGSPSFEVEDEFRIAGGLYGLAVDGDSDAFSEYVVLRLVRATGTRRSD
jgi:hypothetical protein